MKILITGGCGFIGTSLIKELNKNKKIKIRVIDNLSNGTIDDLKEIINFKKISNKNVSFNTHQFLLGDIRNLKDCVKSTKNIDTVIHLAANTGVPQSIKNPITDFNTNAIGTFNLLESCRINKVKKFIFASSAAVGGTQNPPINEKIVPKPISPYGASKLCGEAYCSTYFQSYNINTTVLRFGNVYGVGSKNKTSVVAKFINNIIKYKKVEIYGNGIQTRDFIYIDDLISAIVTTINNNKISGEIFQIASSKETSIVDLVKKLQKTSKLNGITDFKIIYRKKLEGEMMKNFSDIKKAKKMLNWVPKTNLQNGLNATFKYFTSKI